MCKPMELVLVIACLASTSCATPRALSAHPADPLKVQAAEAGIAGRQPRRALCLSGGGYRAMLFNAGAVLAIEHKGRLEEVDTITSVSGGSILNGKLAIAWPTLRDESHVRWLLEANVIRDIQNLADNTIDVPAVMGGLLMPFKTNSTVLADYYDKYLFDHMSLSDLPPPNIERDPQTPIFIFQTTDLASGRPFFFTNLTSTGGPGRNFKLLDIPLSAVVTASGAFPPVITPVVIDFTEPVEQGSEFFLDRNNGTYGGPISTLAVKLAGNTLRFTDGGIADNRGLPECERAGGNGMISDAATFETVDESDGVDPLSVAFRVSDIVYSRAERQMTITFIQSDPKQGMVRAMLGGMDTATKQTRDEADYYDKLLSEPILFGYKYFDILLYWAEIRKKTSILDTSVIALSPDARYLIDNLNVALCHAMIPTRLKKLDRNIQDNIINMGYVSALSAIELQEWSARYKRFWLDKETVSDWDNTNFPLLLFDPPRNAQATIEGLGKCQNQAWVDAFVVNAKNEMEAFTAVLNNASTPHLLPIFVNQVDDEIADQVGKGLLDALREKQKKDLDKRVPK